MGTENKGGKGVKPRKIPMRQCLGCNEHKPKVELIRIVRSPEGVVGLDLTGKKSGRGAYICPDPACLQAAPLLSSTRWQPVHRSSWMSTRSTTTLPESPVGWLKGASFLIASSSTRRLTRSTTTAVSLS